MRVRYHGTEAGLVLSTKRINILSPSAISTVILTMNRAVGEKQSNEIAEIIHEVCEDLMGWYREGKAISTPDPGKARTDHGWLVYPIWPAVGATAVVAAPGSFKSFIAEAIGVQVATGATVLNRNTKVRNPRSVLYLDWEANEETFAERLAAICRGAGLDLKPYLGYKEMSARLADVAIGLAEEIRAHKYEAVIVDSMSASIGGGMVDDDAVNSFWDAIRTMAVPTLVLAHKSAENIQRRRKRFFGSIMSEARVRMAWNAEKATTTNHVVWECFKDNNTGHIKDRLAWEIEIDNTGADDTQQLQKAAFLGVNPNNISLGTSDEPERQPVESVADQIAKVLEGEKPMSVGEIAMRTHKSTANVRAQLSRHSDRFDKDSTERWSLVGTKALF
jgi:hypothetical protein